MILIGSLLIGVLFKVGDMVPVQLMIISALLINFGLAVCMWYSERINRPMLYQVMIIFYLGITAYCCASINENRLFGVYYEGKLIAKVSLLFLMSAILVSAIGHKRLISCIKSRVDLWCPPIWPLVVAGVASYISDKSLSYSTLRLCVLMGMSGFILVTAYKNNRTQNRTVAYQITTKHYLRYLCVFGLLAFSINQFMPKVKEMPGTKLIKQLTNNWGLGFRGDLETTSELNRNVSESEEILLKLRSDMPIYLREVAYSSYDKGKWALEEQEIDPVPINEQTFYSQKKLFYLVLDKLAEKVLQEDEDKDEDESELLEPYKEALLLPSNERKNKSAYIEEIQPFKQYLTCNEVQSINVLEQDKIGYYADGNCFVPISDEDDVTYTIDYAYYPLKRGTREYEILKNLDQKKYMALLEWVMPQLTTQERTEEIEALYTENINYASINKRYTQLAHSVRENIEEYAKWLTRDMEGDLQKAQRICYYLKSSGEYTYQLNAPYVDEKQDPVVDFIYSGKAGICQDFASSMTLLCRGVGIPARYVVGYSSGEIDWEEEDIYIIREKHAHAFVEAYIAGYGWMTFDPTPSKLTEDDLIGGDIGNIGNNNIDINFNDLTVLIIVLGVFMLILFWLYPLAWLRASIWKWYILRLPAQRSIGLLMQQTLKLLEDKSIFMEQEETVSKLAKRLNDQYLFDITPITKPFEDYYYGNKMPLESEMLAAYECYKHIKKKRKWQILTDPDSRT